MTDGARKRSLLVQFDDSEWDKLDLPPGCDRREVRRSIEHSLWQFNCETHILRPPYSADDLRRKVRAARELLNDPDLLVPWASAEREKLMTHLKDIADIYELEAEKLEAEAAATPAKRPGRRLDWPLQMLIDQLIRVWEQAGGKVGGGVQDGGGGPLIRLIKYAVRHVDVEPTSEMVRHWIRRFKRRELEWNEISSDGDN